MTTTNLTDLEKQLLSAVWKAWHELSAIRARDGVPYERGGYKASVDEEYFSSVVDECNFAIETATGEQTKPWFPAILGGPNNVWTFSERDSAAFIAALLAPPEPNEALKAAAKRYKGRKAP